MFLSNFLQTFAGFNLFGYNLANICRIILQMDNKVKG
nr:MAG TPA: hypothetical protein [Caudoviricetes sp.]